MKTIFGSAQEVEDFVREKNMLTVEQMVEEYSEQLEKNEKMAKIQARAEKFAELGFNDIEKIKEMLLNLESFSDEEIIEQLLDN